MQQLESDIFAGLNSDDEDRAIPKGDYRYALNIHTGSSEGGNKGAIVNMKGNTLISVSLPAGTNKVVGTTRDQATQSIIYLVWNSNSDDQIYQFSEKTQTIELIAKADFNFQENKIIHGLDLVDSDKLYWTDNNNEPRKINIKKAKNNKPREINLYFDIGSVDIWKTTDVTYTLTINGIQTITGLNAGPSTPGSSSRDEVAERFAYYINHLIETWTGVPVAPNIIASGCGPYVSIKFTDSLENVVDFTSSYGTIQDWVPQNFYIDYNFDVINQIKAPSPCNPSFSYGRDANRDVNSLEEKTFQFAVRYIFDDYEITVLSPYSCLAYEFTCGVAVSGSNYVDIDFSEPRLGDRSSLAVIKKIDILVREGNDGKFKIAQTLDQWDFGIVNNTYRFYNDGIYTVISDADAFKLYDTVPRKSETQEFMKNRLFHGNYTQGFDAVCVDAEVDVTYEETTALETHTVSGYLLIKNYFSGNIFTDNIGQPIYIEDSGDGAQWGGLSDDNSVSDSGNVNNVFSDYKQTLPLNGFTLYLAGTSHVAQTRQQVYDYVTGSWKETNDPSLPFSMSIPDASDGIPLGDNSSKRNNIREYLYQVAGGFRQVFTFNNVPDGTYVLRVSSHRLTSADLNSLTKEYENQSTNLIGTSGDRILTVNGANLYLAETGVIADLTCFNSGTVSGDVGKALSGYLVKNTGQTGTDRIRQPKIEKAGIHIRSGALGLSHQTIASGYSESDLDPLWFNSGYAYTDHNGYWFCSIRTNNVGGSDIEIDPAGDSGRSMQIDLNMQAGADFYDFDGNLYTGPTSASGKPNNDGSKNVDVLCQTSESLTLSSAYIKTTLLDSVSGLPLSGAEIVISDSGVSAITDANGIFKTLVYGDTKTYVDSGASYTKRRVFSAYILPIAGSCSLSMDLISPPVETIPIGPGSPPTEYNASTSEFPFSLVSLNIFIDTGKRSGYKRGWDGRFGLIYRDEGSRMSFVNTDEDLQTHITFYTETDENGNQNNYGIPILTWSINHIPPSWATHYQWVRTKNEQLDDYLQWVVDDVAYVDCEDFSLEVPYTDSEIAKISIRNIAEYADCGAKSFIGIAIDDSYRVRFIKDELGNFYTTYIDLPILSATADNIFVDKSNDIEIKPGVLFEVYRPKSTIESSIYYEFGECFVISKKGLHSGETQIQKLWDFSDNAYAGAIGSVSYATNVAFTTDTSISPLYSGETHYFEVGDKVKIVQAIGYTNSSYEGLHTIVEILSDKTVVIDLAFGSSTPAEPGMMNAPAMGTFGCGDAYYRFRTINTCVTDLEGWYCDDLGASNLSTFNYIDDASVSDFYLSEYQGIGRLNIENANAREIISKNQVTWSGTIIEDSYVNSLNRFDGVDIEDLPEEFGDLMKLQRGENVLLAIAQYRSASLYIQESVLTTTDGTGNLSASDKVIGTVRAFKDAYGTMNPESVAEYQSVVYWWDLNNGSVVRYTQAGLQALSDNKFADFFAQKAKDILSRNLPEPPRTIGVYDPYFVEYIISFDSYDIVEGVPAVEGQTLAYSEWISRWTSFYSYLPEKMEYTGMVTVAFKDGSLWLQDSNSLRNNFFGVQYNSQIQPIVNEGPKNMKAYRAIVVESNEAWSCPKITIPANSKYINGMETRITKSRFINKEGIFYSEIPKDTLTPGFATQLEALINGRDMRGKILNILFQNDDTSEVVFFSFNVKSNLSELSNR